MGDSDDEYDRKRRDKFRGERNEYRDAPRRPPPADDMRTRREDWSERDWGRGRGPPRSIDYRLGGGHRVPHEFSPPNKRPRVEWDRYSHDSYSSGYGSGYDHPPGPGYQGHGNASRDSSDGHPQLLSFKAWLSTQDDSISDQDALNKYAEYKQEFKRQQLNEFFVAHREEEWFRGKYHPDDSSKRKEELSQNLKRRVDLFVEFLSKGRFDGITLDSDLNSEKIIKLMDWFVIRLEGGTDEEANKLLSDEPPALRMDSIDDPVKQTAKAVESSEAMENGKSKATSEEGENSASDSEGENDREESEGIKKRKHSLCEDGEKKEGSSEKDDPENKKIKKRKNSEDSGSSASENEECSEEKKQNDSEAKDEANVGASKKKKEDEVPQLHRTSSIFVRNLAPTITKQEVESLCKKYNGFIRIAIADPQPDKRWFRRGWVTFKRNVNIKEICWNLQNVRLRDTELGPIVNRDLSRRVRTVNGITPHKNIVRNDIRLASKIIQHLDAKWKLWDDGTVKQGTESYGVYSSNPVLKNITNYLIEEASAEEEELLGVNSVGGEENGEAEKTTSIERDDELISVLDRLVLYLRFVHSLDFYNHAEYPYEDDMPNRLGIIHCRGMPPTLKVTSSELLEYNKNFEQKISTFMQVEVQLTEEECKVLGMKDEDTEVEKFISANTQELGKDKWLCPLSGKKFKGPEFVRKHILNKHGEKLEEVKKEVLFFNNYLRDPKRPHEPDAPKPATERNAGPPQPSMIRQREPMMHEREYPPPPMYPPHPYGFGGYGPPGRFPPYPPYREFHPRARLGPMRGGVRDHGNRGMISYRDLDAPAEPDDF